MNGNKSSLILILRSPFK